MTTTASKSKQKHTAKTQDSKQNITKNHTNTNQQNLNIRVNMLYAKIHRAHVTDADLNYIGSISLDKNLMEESGILENMEVEILNINNGERFKTYAIEAKKGSGAVCLNGAAARKVQKGDVVIIVAYASMKLKHAKKFKPKIVFVDSKNRIIEKGTKDV